MTFTPGTTDSRNERTGAMERLATGFPFGRPRWLHTVTSAP